MSNVYGPLSGDGEVVLSAPRFVSMLGVEITSLPPGAAVRDVTGPRRLMKVGWFAPGRVASDPNWSALSFFEKETWVEFERQAFRFPYPGVFADRIRYHLEPGGVATLFVDDTSVITPLDQPWARNATLWNQSANIAPNGGTAVNTFLTYTVPAGKWLLVSHLSISFYRSTVATTPAVPSGLMSVVLVGNTNPILRVNIQDNVIPSFHQDTIASPLYLPAGTVLNATMSNSDTGGQLRGNLLAAGLLFDA